MLLEIGKPVSLIFCILSLYALFHTAFLSPSSDLHQRIWDSSLWLALAAVVSSISGLVFQEAAPGKNGSKESVTATLPVQLFCWASGIMLLLFLVSWYMETYCVFYKDVRRL